MSRTMATLVASCAATCAVLMSVSGAAVVATTGAVELVAIPPSLVLGDFESSTRARVMFERSRLLSLPLNVDITAAGLYDQTADLTPGPIPAGTMIQSYILHADPVAGTQRVYEGSVRFDEPVVGIIIGLNRLRDTDLFLGAPGTAYDGTDQARALEFNAAGTGDEVSLSMTPDRRVVTIRWSTSTALDEVRILTLPTPGTSALAVLGLAAGLRRRR